MGSSSSGCLCALRASNAALAVEPLAVGHLEGYVGVRVHGKDGRGFALWEPLDERYVARNVLRILRDDVVLVRAEAVSALQDLQVQASRQEGLSVGGRDEILSRMI